MLPRYTQNKVEEQPINPLVAIKLKRRGHDLVHQNPFLTEERKRVFFKGEAFQDLSCPSCYPPNQNTPPAVRHFLEFLLWTHQIEVQVTSTLLHALETVEVEDVEEYSFLLYQTA